MNSGTPHTTFKASARRTHPYTERPYTERPYTERPYTERPDMECWEVVLQHNGPPVAEATITSPTFTRGSVADEVCAIRVLRDLLDFAARRRAFALQTGVEVTSCGADGCLGVYRRQPDKDHFVFCGSEHCAELSRLQDEWVYQHPLPYSVVFEATESLPESLTKSPFQ